jgi:dienelactone hydrolase
VWLALALGAGWAGYFLGALPGAMLLAAGVAALLWPGDPRTLQFGTIAAFIAVPLGVISLAWAGFLGGLALIALSVAAFVAEGTLSLQQGVPVAELPETERSLPLAAAVAVDEALLGFIITMALRRRRQGVLREGAAAVAFYRENGWMENPADYHKTPPLLENPRLHPARAYGIQFEHLAFESGYQPHPGEPGGDRWRSYDFCRSAHAWVMRHESPERPWLMCIHGLQMGWPLADLAAFRAQWLHRRLGLNLIFPVLPFHGKRGYGLVSGNGFISEQILDTVHAFAQACWDLRRMLSWVRSQGAAAVGVHGLSLGGYTAALIASLDEGLSCAIPGIPAVDFAALAWQHAPPFELERFSREGLGREELAAVLRPVAPLVLKPKVPTERRFLFGGTADRMVPPDQVRALWHHWGKPRIHWYPGSHVSFSRHPSVGEFIKEALRESGLTQ